MYLLVVVALGALLAVLPPGDVALGVGAVVVLVVVGTLLPVPNGAEVAAGAGALAGVVALSLS